MAPFPRSRRKSYGQPGHVLNRETNSLVGANLPVSTMIVAIAATTMDSPMRFPDSRSRITSGKLLLMLPSGAPCANFDAIETVMFGMRFSDRQHRGPLTHRIHEGADLGWR